MAEVEEVQVPDESSPVETPAPASLSPDKSTEVADQTPAPPQEQFAEVRGRKVPISTLERWEDQVKGFEPLAERNRQLEAALQAARPPLNAAPPQEEAAPTLESLYAAKQRGEFVDTDDVLEALTNERRLQGFQGAQAQIVENQTAFRDVIEKHPELISGNEKYNAPLAQAFEETLFLLTGGNQNSLLILNKNDFNKAVTMALNNAELVSGAAKIKWLNEEKERMTEGDAQAMPAPGGGSAVPAPAKPTATDFDAIVERRKKLAGV